MTMNTQYAVQNHPKRQEPSAVVTRRRRWLGIVLIIVGSIWASLLLDGKVGASPLVVEQVAEAWAMLESLAAGDSALAIVPAAYGMLAFCSIRGA
jgi:hypothetical protein